MFKYSVKSLLSKKTISILFSIAICIAISISMLSINISSQIEEGFYQADKKYDIIVGPKGSDTQLVMSNLFFVDNPLGTIPVEYLENIKKEYDLNKVVPIAMADSYKGNRVVGTSNDLLEGYDISLGSIFENDFEIVVGSNIAERYSLSIGDKIVTSHGVSAINEDHSDSPYTLKGILKKTNTSYDNTIFTTVESVWKAHSHNDSEEDVHGHEDEHAHEDEHGHEEGEEAENHENEMGYTALLIKSGNLATANKLETDLNDNLEVQAINTTKVLRKLINNIDMSKQVALLLCIIIIILATILTCVMSFLMLTNSKKDIKLLTFLGMKKRKIYAYTIYQVGILISISVITSLLINRWVLTIVSSISSSMGIVLDLNKVYKGEFYITFVYIALILVSTLIYTYIRTNKEK